MSAPALSAVSSDAFLKLFVTQLRHQDPTAPTDPNAMMTQLAQMTQVEKLDSMSESFSRALAVERLNLARGLIGSEVTYSSGGSAFSGLVERAAVQQGAVGVHIGGRFVEIERILQVAPPAAQAS
jgi:flagellar basal-body rod modification protein FlgD